MQVEFYEIPFAGAPETLRVVSRRVRSDFLPRRRVGETATTRTWRYAATTKGLLAGETTQMGIFQQPAGKKAGIAQLVEHRLPKPRVAGSIPVARSNKSKELAKQVSSFFIETCPRVQGGCK